MSPLNIKKIKAGAKITNSSRCRDQTSTHYNRREHFEQFPKCLRACRGRRERFGCFPFISTGVATALQKIASFEQFPVFPTGVAIKLRNIESDAELERLKIVDGRSKKSMKENNLKSPWKRVANRGETRTLGKLKRELVAGFAERWRRHDRGRLEVIVAGSTHRCRQNA